MNRILLYQIAIPLRSPLPSRIGPHQAKESCRGEYLENDGGEVPGERFGMDNVEPQGRIARFE